jgi:hypothetical protein
MVAIGSRHTWQARFFHSCPAQSAPRDADNTGCTKPQKSSRLYGILREVLICLVATIVASFAPGFISAAMFSLISSHLNNFWGIWLGLAFFLLIETAVVVLLVYAAFDWTSSKITRFILLANAAVCLPMLVYYVVAMSSFVLHLFIP